MGKKKRFGIVDWLTAVACGIISFGYFSNPGHDSKIVGPFINTVFEFFECIVGEYVAAILVGSSFFVSGFLLGWIIVWCLQQLCGKLDSLEQ